MDLVFGLVVLILIGIGLLRVAKVLRDIQRGRHPKFRAWFGRKLRPWDDAPPPHAPGSPVVPLTPGRYRVSGVDRDTRMDVTEYVHADSPENARAKVELNNVVVTRVEAA